MSAPAAPHKLGEFTGKIARLGAGGFGFIACADLQRDAYFKAEWVTAGDPDVGREVEFVALEYPEDKIIAREIRVVGAPAPSPVPVRPSPSAPFAGRIRGLEAMTVAPRASAPSPEPKRPEASTRPAMPSSLPAAVRSAEEQLRSRVIELRAKAADVSAKAEAASVEIDATRDAADRRRADLEAQLVALGAQTEVRVEALCRSAEQLRATAVRLRGECDALEGTIADATRHAAVEHVTTTSKRFRELLAERENVATALDRARQDAVATAGADTVAKYEDTRHRAAAETDPDLLEALTLLERKRRAAVGKYAEALDNVDAWTKVEAPFWLVSGGNGSVLVIAPYDPTAPESDGPSWRIHSALVHATEQLRRVLGDDAPTASVEPAAVASCAALRLVGLDSDMLPLALEDAFNARATLSRLRISVHFEELREMQLDVDDSSTEVESLDGAAAVRPSAAAGGTLQSVSRRIGLPLDSLVGTLVASGLPFDDDSVDSDTEESLRVMLGIVVRPDERAPTAPSSPPAVMLDPALDIARRIVTKLIRAHVIGGKHTRADNVWGHGFSDVEKVRARTIVESLVRLGVLREKKNMGSRHVSIEPRMLAVARDLADGRCTDRTVTDAVIAS